MVNNMLVLVQSTAAHLTNKQEHMTQITQLLLGTLKKKMELRDNCFFSTHWVAFAHLNGRLQNYFREFKEFKSKQISKVTVISNIV